MKSDKAKSIVIIVVFTVVLFAAGIIVQKALGQFSYEHNAYTWVTTTSPYGRNVTRALYTDAEPYRDGELVYSSYGEIDFDELKEINSDIVGWLTVGDIYDWNNIDHPVFQSYNNTYYQSHNANGDESLLGALYADCANKFENGEYSDNTIIYGSNPEGYLGGDKMFYPLERYLKGYGDDDAAVYYAKYPTVTFETPYEKSEWEIFAVSELNITPGMGDIIPYEVTSFDNEFAFNRYVFTIQDKSVISPDIDVKYGDKLLTLVTPYYPLGYHNRDTRESRLVVTARKISDEDTTKIAE
ncbi:MAG: class B sortase [Ruminiclostridium sp.]|nr:class B sortase [Ruminiclostridium sp.]